MAVVTCPKCGRIVKNLSPGVGNTKRGDCSKHGRVEVRVIGPRGHISGPAPSWHKGLPKKGSTNG